MKFIPPVLTAVVAGLALWSAPTAAQAPLRSVLRQLYGDLAFEVRTRGDGTLTLGVADGRTTVAFSLMAVDLRRWSDSVSRVLAAPNPRRGRSAKWDAVVAGPGVAAGSMALTRRVAPGDTGIVLLVTDPAFQGVRTPLGMIEARALAAAMKRAAVASLAPPVPAAKGKPPALPKKPPQVPKPPPPIR